MRKTLKKLLSVFLSTIIVISVCSCVFTVFAENEKQDIPIIQVVGQGNSLFDANGNKIYPDDIEISDVLADKEKINPVLKNLALGLAIDNWEPYCDSLCSIFEEIYKPIVLDESGEASNGTGIKWTINNPQRKTGNYGVFDYQFNYDWRLDPVSNSEILAKYIDNVIAATGHSKVTLIGRCEGSSIVASYLANHGDENKVDTCIMYVPVCTGMNTVGALFSGRVNLDPDSVDKYVSYWLKDNNAFAETDGLADFLSTLVSILNKVYVLEAGTKTVEGIYKKVYKNVIPRILSVSFGTFPGYWSMVNDEWYEDAKKLNFAGKEEQYAGLIEKIDNYHYNVQMKLDDILNNLHDKGMKVAVVAKYGKNVPPIFDGCQVQGDRMVELENMSFGASSSLVGKTLSQSYIEQAQLNGTAKYISPDKVVDASTCMFPDNTWIIKNLGHSDFPGCIDRLLLKISQSAAEMTITSYEEYPQFLYYNSEDASLTPMTEDDEDISNNSGWTKDPFKLFFNFLKNLFRLLTSLIKK